MVTKELMIEISKARITLQLKASSLSVAQVVLKPILEPSLEVSSLRTAFYQVKILSQNYLTQEPDGQIKVEDVPEEKNLFFHREEDFLLLKGPISFWEEKCSDKRYTLWGNLGLLYRFTLYLLEKKHDLYSLHACSLYDVEQNHLWIIAGGAGSGKTIFLLSGLEAGLKLFSTETTHFQVKEDKVTWFKGSLLDNVRVRTLEKYFPYFLSSSFPISPPYKGKVAIDLSSFQTPFDKVDDLKRVTFIFPHIEEGWSTREERKINNKKEMAQLIYANISSKLSESIILYDSLPIIGWDESALAQKRWEAAKTLLANPVPIRSLAILSSPDKCWGELLKNKVHRQNEHPKLN